MVWALVTIIKKQNPSCVHPFSLENLTATVVILKLYLRDLGDVIENRTLNIRISSLFSRSDLLRSPLDDACGLGSVITMVLKFECAAE